MRAKRVTVRSELLCIAKLNFQLKYHDEVFRDHLYSLYRPYHTTPDHQDLVLLTELCVGGGGKEKSKSVSGNMSLSLE